ncbi:phage baseplate assembly protein [Oceanobacter antarcticus]|uniref:Phage baseplate assembly protein n=1 Tax=Oceanobacter antarcticus TaxID=3133425 RepID=A0ABW8NEP9_9GAMM
MNELILVIDSKEYTGWKRVAVSRGIEQGPHQFEVEAAPDLDADRGIFAIEDGMAVDVYVDSDQVTSGYIDDVDVSYDKRTSAVTVRGRSKLGDLVDCSTVGQQVKPGQTLAGIASTLCANFGIAVVVDSTATAPANKAFASADLALDAGQPVWEFLEELARVRGVMLISTATGDLQITRAGTTQAAVTLELGQNILAAKGTRSHRSLFSTISVTGQQPAFISSDTSATSQSGATETGDAVRHRPMVLFSDSPADVAACEAQAKHRRRIGYGRSRQVIYTVQGWRQTDGGDLWLPNQLVQINDSRNQLANAQRLISETRLMMDIRSGRTTEITVMPPEAFDLLAEPATTVGYVL